MHPLSFNPGHSAQVLGSLAVGLALLVGALGVVVYLVASKKHGEKLIFKAIVGGVLGGILASAGGSGDLVGVASDVGRFSLGIVKDVAGSLLT
jgi:hypothetical protein